MSDLIGIGKYSSERDAVLHFMCTSDWANESFGDVSDYGYYVWRISNDPQDVSPKNTEIVSLIESSGYGIELTEALARELTGNFIVWETETGAVNVQSYENSTLCGNAFRAWLAEYEEWEGASDE